MAQFDIPSPMQPSTINETSTSSGQAVNIGGRSYDVCVKLWGSGRVLLLVESFEDIKAPGC
ncbi:hypothetical protein CVIRNUC_000144 [Coccomyxa viridis]|uniref:Uncharacterized protein n=1 Tax=Coccomyxa viridis TaxID=1274662 RepID=A0AAV1HQY4_9CHLO|nr:hypothetical protein CVIRNUC_000144 [Coccomyxa viridis]